MGIPFLRDQTLALPRASAIDWIGFIAAAILVGFGLVTMNSFSGENGYYERQVLWFLISIAAFLAASLIDWSFLKRTGTLLALFSGVCALLLILIGFGQAVKGAQSWFSLGFASFQPTDLAKVALILVLAKYFSRRHVEIAHIRHIIVSGIYAAILAGLVAVQPDFGGALVIVSVWFGIVLVSGVSKKHLAFIILAGALAFGLMWQFGFKDYQKARIMTFIHPLSDLQGTGYNAYQSTIAVGSGEWVGKGIGYGTQSRLKFLPEYETDFIFAAFAEEWGFIGVVIFISVFGVLIFRIIYVARRGKDNFEILFALGLATMFVSHFVVNVGMNMGLLPVTGITLPFTSYGGSHLLTSFIALGILNSFRRHNARSIHKDLMKNELVGV